MAQEAEESALDVVLPMDGSDDGNRDSLPVAPVVPSPNRRRRKRRKAPPNAADLAARLALVPMHGGKGKPAAPAQAPELLPQMPEGLSLLVNEEFFQSMQHRKKYMWLYRRFSYWATRNVVVRPVDALTPLSENPSVQDLLVYAAKDFKSLALCQKNAVMQFWAERVHAPEFIVVSIDHLWAPDVQAKHAGFDSSKFIYSKTALLTWQGPWGVVSMSEEETRDLTIDALVEILKKRDDILSVWKEFEVFLKKLAEEHFVRYYAQSFEICTKTFADSKQVRVHAHAFLLREDARVQIHKKEKVVFKGGAAVKSQSTGANSVLRGSGVWCGCYYLLSPKIGSILRTGSVRPYLDFGVKPEWILNMVQSEKMTFTAAMQQMSMCGKGYTRYMQDLKAWQSAKEELQLEDHVRRVQAYHTATNYAFKTYPIVEEWKASVWQPHLRRKKILVIEGPSGIGKTEFIKQIAGPERTLEISADGMTSPYLRNFIPSQHKVIFWDECKVDLVIAYRKLFQCPASWITLGVSPTGRDVYRVWLNDAAHVIASNRWMAGLEKMHNVADRQWVEENQVFLHVSERMYTPREDAQAQDAES